MLANIHWPEISMVEKLTLVLQEPASQDNAGESDE
jgi:hypothetical protein